MLFTMRYKRAMQGIQSGFIEVRRPTGDAARDLATAERIGKAFCDREPGFKFIHIQPAVLADDGLLPNEYSDRASVDESPAKDAGKKGGKAA